MLSSRASVGTINFVVGRDVGARAPTAPLPPPPPPTPHPPKSFLSVVSKWAIGLPEWAQQCHLSEEAASNGQTPTAECHNEAEMAGEDASSLSASGPLPYTCDELAQAGYCGTYLCPDCEGHQPGQCDLSCGYCTGHGEPGRWPVRTWRITDRRSRLSSGRARAVASKRTRPQQRRLVDLCVRCLLSLLRTRCRFSLTQGPRGGGGGRKRRRGAAASGRLGWTATGVCESAGGAGGGRSGGTGRSFAVVSAAATGANTPLSTLVILLG